MASLLHFRAEKDREMSDKVAGLMLEEGYEMQASADASASWSK